jgi:hypothetical protein
MMPYTLSGFSALTRSNQSFGIPYFSSRLTNHSYAQELDENYKIIGFFQFKPHNYRIIKFKTPLHSKSIGDDGILSFQTSDNEVVSGVFTEIPNHLKIIELSDFSPFFRIEAYSLLGNDEMLHQSNCEVANLFRKNDHSNFWIEASQRLALKSLAQRYNIKEKYSFEQEELDVLIDKLLENPSDEDWYNEWRRHWGVSRGNLKLVKLVLWWVDKAANSEPYLPYIFEDILTRFSDHEETKRNALQWLSRCDYDSDQWPKIWELCTLGSSLEEPFFSYGLSFLDEMLRSDHLIANEPSWNSIWSKLWEEKRHVTFMIGLAQSAAQRFGSSDIFIEKVLSKVLDANRLDVSIIEILSGWLKKAINIQRFGNRCSSISYRTQHTVVRPEVLLISS